MNLEPFSPKQEWLNQFWLKFPSFCKQTTNMVPCFWSTCFSSSGRFVNETQNFQKYRRRSMWHQVAYWCVDLQKTTIPEDTYIIYENKYIWQLAIIVCILFRVDITQSFVLLSPLWCQNHSTWFWFSLFSVPQCNAGKPKINGCSWIHDMKSSPPVFCCGIVLYFYVQKASNIF